MLLGVSVNVVCIHVVLGLLQDRLDAKMISTSPQKRMAAGAGFPILVLREPVNAHPAPPDLPGGVILQQPVQERATRIARSRRGRAGLREPERGTLTARAARYEGFLQPANHSHCGLPNPLSMIHGGMPAQRMEVLP